MYFDIEKRPPDLKLTSDNKKVLQIKNKVMYI